MSLGDFLERPSLKNIRNAAATIRSIGFFVTCLAALGLLAYLNIEPEMISREVAMILAVSIAIWTLTIACFAIYIRHVHDPADYEVIEVEGRLHIESINGHHRYTYVKKQTIRALRNDVRVIEFKAHWTGHSSKGKPRVDPVYRDQVVLDGKHAEEDGRVHRWVYPGRPIGRGQSVPVGIQHVHEDDLAEQRPYYRDGGGRFRTKNLTVVASFPIAEDPAPVEGAVWNTHLPVGQNNQVGPYKVERTLNKTAGTVEYTVRVPDPKRHHSYGVRWRWPQHEISQSGETPQQSPP